MVAIKLPDGSILEMESGVNGFDSIPVHPRRGLRLGRLEVS